VYDLRFSPVREADGHIVGAAHILRNATEQARMERALRASEERHRLGLVAMTGWGQEKDKQEAADAGFDAHLTKPVDPDDLERMLAGDDKS
jgi:CheY-like chemotaxis protein